MGLPNLVFEAGKEPGDGNPVFRFLFEGNFRPRQQANGHTRLPDR